MEISRQKVLITGANRGIGRAFAKRCAEDKAQVHLLLRKRNEELETELIAAGAKSVVTWECDLGSRANIEKILPDLIAEKIDILFNNAGMLTGGLIEEQPLDGIYEMLQVNVNALIHLTRALLPGMMERKQGYVINNSSVSAYMHFPCASTYAASKAAVAAFTDCIEMELKDTGVKTLLLITPGIKTQMFDDIEKLYSKNFEIPQDSISPTKYAEMIREAVLNDLRVLEPSGLTGLGLRVARHARPLFQFAVKRRFHR